MAEPSATPSTESLEKLLSNPELIRTIGSIMGAPSESSPDAPADDGLSRVLSDPELMAKLPKVVEMLKPMLQSTPASTSTPAESIPTAARPSAPPHSCRDDLLLALKPFLSPERAATIDVILRLGRLGSVLQALK